MTEYCLYRLTGKEKLFFSLAVVTGCAALGVIFYRSFFTLLLYPIVYRRCEKIYTEHLCEKRKKKLIVEFKDFIYLVSSSMATGKHMLPSIKDAVESLGRIYPDSLMVNELEMIIYRVEDTGADEAELLSDFAGRTGLEDIEDFAQIYQCCRQTGGNMVAAINKAAEMISDKIVIENEISTIASQKKLEGRIISAMPVAIIIFLQLISPDYLNVMYETPAGRFLMTAALGATAAAYVVIERITDIEI